MCICALEHYLRFTRLSRNLIMSFKDYASFCIEFFESSVSKVEDRLSRL